MLKAGNEYTLHSPFVFDLYTQIVKSDKQYYVFLYIENLRKELLGSTQSIEVEDMGAGSKRQKSNIRKISNIARNAGTSRKKGELLFKLVDYFQPKLILELGTSVGIGTIYLKAASRKSKLFTFEGCPQTLKLAKENLGKTDLMDQVVFVEGNIDKTLVGVVEKVDQIDFVFFDANHRYEPTLRYFETCLSKTNEWSVFIFDDIYWSDEMLKAWQEIIRHPKVSISIDLFHLGIVFFRKNQAKEHFILRF